MAILGTTQKQPREVLDVDINYATVLAGRSDTIVSFTVETVRIVTTPIGTGTLTIVSSVRTGNIIKITYSGGTTNESYKVTILATSSAGLVYEDEFTVIVVEV